MKGGLSGIEGFLVQCRVDVWYEKFTRKQYGKLKKRGCPRFNLIIQPCDKGSQLF